MRCGNIIYDDDGDYDERVDLPEFCSLCNDDLRRGEFTLDE